MRGERHMGAVGDAYRITDAVAAEARRGGGDYPDLEVGDVLLRLDHSGDCFSTYAVFRDGTRLLQKWRGYELGLDAIGNVVDDLDTLPPGFGP